MAAKLLLVAASLEIDYTLISAPQTGERETMDHKYRHLSSGLDSDSVKDIFCDPSLSLSVWSDDDLFKIIINNYWPKLWYPVSAFALEVPLRAVSSAYMYIEKEKTQQYGR